MAAISAQRAVLATCWALCGVLAIFADAVLALGGRGLQTVRAGLAPMEWVALYVLVALFVYGEGVRALQHRWIPLVLARCIDVARARGLHQLLAPLYAMLLVGAPRRTLARAWLGVAGIVLAVLLVRALPDPWRGIIDLAVAAALAWGLLVLLRGAPRVLAAAAQRQGATS